MDISNLDKRWFIIGGIGLYIIAWIYYYSPLENTSIGILFHYAALGLIGFGLLDQDKKQKIFIFIVVYIVSLILDYPFYELRHGLSLGLFYYVAVNCIHVTLLLSILVIDKKSQILSTIVFIVFLVTFYIWLTLSNVHIFLMSIIIFSISLPALISFIIYYLAIEKISES